jgi:hypothetical protein
MAYLKTLVNAKCDLLLERFNDLEDKDYVADVIDIDHKDYHSLINCKFINEHE